MYQMGTSPKPRIEPRRIAGVHSFFKFIREPEESELFSFLFLCKLLLSWEVRSALYFRQLPKERFGRRGRPSLRRSDVSLQPGLRIYGRGGNRAWTRLPQGD